MKLNKKNLIYYLIELIYLALCLMIILFIHNHYFSFGNYDAYGIISCIIIIISLSLTFPSPYNKIICALPLIFYTLYVSGQKRYFDINQIYYHFSFNNLFKYGNKIILVIILVISIIFILLYYFIQKNFLEKRIPIKYRIVAPALLALCLLFYGINLNEINDIKLLQSYNINETDYYKYIHIDNSKEFVESFGIYNYFIKDLEKESIDDNKEIKEYLSNLPSPTKNDYSGIFEDKNVIFIQMNNFAFSFLNDLITPNLYNYFVDSIQVNFFSSPKDITIPNNDPEFMANLSLVPNSIHDHACYKYDNNYFPTTLAKIFKNKGYATNFFINDYNIYFNREKMVNAYGYDEFYDQSRVGDNNMTTLEYAEKLAGIYMSADYKVMSYWVINADLNRNDEIVNKIKTVFPDIEEDEMDYYVNIIHLDEVITLFMNKLAEAKRMEDTVIVLFGDGGAINYGTSELIFYNNGQQGRYYKRATLLDLLPTAANLFNLDYDYKQVLGRDVFDDNYYGISYLFDPGIYELWETNIGGYNYLYHYYFNIPDVEQEVLKEFVDDFNKRILISFKIQDNDYFRGK